MGRYQTEIYYPTEVSYLKSVLLWLQKYWTGPAVRIYPLRAVPQASPHYNRRDVIIDLPAFLPARNVAAHQRGECHYPHGTTALRLTTARLAHIAQISSVNGGPLVTSTQKGKHQRYVRGPLIWRKPWLKEKSEGDEFSAIGRQTTARAYSAMDYYFDHLK